MANPEIDNYVSQIIYNVLISDRHCEPEIFNFNDKDDAILFARAKAKKYCYCPELDYVEKDYEADTSNWILLITYSSEGDYVRVTKGEIK